MKGVYCRMSPESTQRRLSKLKELQELSLQQKINLTVQLLRHCQNGRAIIMFSGGKDSAVIADVAIRAGLKFDAIYSSTQLEYGDHVEKTKKLAEYIGINLQVAKQDFHPFDIWGRTGYYPLFPKRGFHRYTKIFPDLRASPVQCCYQLKERVSNFSMKKNNIEYAIWGLRADESNRRRFLFVDSGFLFKPKKYKWRQCYPILHWMKADIKRYVAQYLPIIKKSIIEPGCRLCATDIMRRRTNLQSYLELDREGFISDMVNSGMAQQLSNITGVPVDAIHNTPELFCKIRKKRVEHVTS